MKLPPITILALNLITMPDIRNELKFIINSVKILDLMKYNMVLEICVTALIRHDGFHHIDIRKEKWQWKKMLETER